MVVLHRMRRLWLDCQGVTAIEYGVLLAVIMLVALTLYTSVGTRLSSFLNTVL